ncbi:hypothetical protein JCM8547_007842 [Rhodosporidiobolus lusitaniae]
MLLPTALAVLASTALALPQQLPFSLSSPSFSSGPTTSDLTSDTSSSLTTLTYPHHPHHRVRLTHPHGLCDNSTSTSGYIDSSVRGHHAFFWAFESRNDPATDPVVLWLNGGPGCSSFTGLLQELGPCRIQEKGEPVDNNATVIFLDQPIGVGYSYRDHHAPKVWTTEAAAEDLYAFLHIFFEKFSDRYAHSDFHLAGESYAGRYLPVFADYIIKQNALAESTGYKKINLVSVLIGNGFTNPLLQYQSYIPAVCSSELGGPYVDASGCKKLEEAWPVCERLVKACWDDPRDSALCLSAYHYCETRMTAPYQATGRSDYNFRKYGEYEEGEWIEGWLNRDDIRRSLGVNPKVKKYTGCSDGIFKRFEESMDVVNPSFQEVANVLDAGVSVLLYVGALDFICNILGVESWSLDPSFTWSNASFFRQEQLKPWYASKEKDEERKPAGQFRQYGRLAFAGVEGAGHFVPYDKPQEALALFNRWVFEQKVGYE